MTQMSRRELAGIKPPLTVVSDPEELLLQVGSEAFAATTPFVIELAQSCCCYHHDVIAISLCLELLQPVATTSLDSFKNAQVAVEPDFGSTGVFSFDEGAFVPSQCSTPQSSAPPQSP